MQQIGDSIQNISSSSSFVDNREKRLEALKEEYGRLRAEYLATPYKIGKQVFKLVPTYINENDSEKIEFNDKNWAH